MNNLEEVDPADEARTYRQKPFRPPLRRGRRRLDHALPARPRADLRAARRSSACPAAASPPDARRIWAASTRCSSDSAGRRGRARAPATGSSPIDGDADHRRSTTCAPIVAADARARPSTSTLVRRRRDPTGRRSTLGATPTTAATGCFLGVGPPTFAPSSGWTRSAAVPQSVRRVRPRSRSSRSKALGTLLQPVGPVRLRRPGGQRPRRRRDAEPADAAPPAAAPVGRVDEDRGENRLLSLVGVVPHRHRRSRARGGAGSSCCFAMHQHLHRRSSTWCRCCRSTAATSPSPSTRRIQERRQRRRAGTSPTWPSCCRSPTPSCCSWRAPRDRLALPRHRQPRSRTDRDDRHRPTARAAPDPPDHPRRTRPTRWPSAATRRSRCSR